jgi:hypothetical protein
MVEADQMKTMTTLCEKPAVLSELRVLNYAFRLD